VSSAASAVGKLPGKARSALGSLGSYLYTSGKALISGFVRGIEAEAGAAESAAHNLVSRVRSYFPFSPAKQGPFSGKGWVSYSGAAIGTALAASLAGQAGTVGAAASRVAAAAQAGLGVAGTAQLAANYSVGTAGSGAGGAAGALAQPVTVRVVVDPAASSGDDLVRWLRKTIRVQGGSVQAVLGT
jgi:hypothetical protein